MVESRVLSIQSHVVHGYVGNKAAVLPLQILGLEVDFINSVQFSNHTGYPKFTGERLGGDALGELVSGLRANGLIGYTHVLTGYIGAASFLRAVIATVKAVREAQPSAVYVCDPVLGDGGRLYVPEELVDIYREEVLPLASVLTPNHFEAELLTRSTIATEDDAFRACAALHARGVRTIVITSAVLRADGANGGANGGADGGKGGGGSGSDGRPFGSARDWLARNPIALKATSMGATYSLADIAAQLWAFDGGAVPLLDRLRRNLGLSLIGLLWVGPLLSVWFDWLAVICPGAGVRPVLLRTLADQLLEAPFMISSIFFFSALVEGHDVAFAMRKVRAGVVRTWASCSVVWAPVQLVNQGLVPLHLRVYFQAFVSFFWDAYMSVAAHAPVPD